MLGEGTQVVGQSGRRAPAEVQHGEEYAKIEDRRTVLAQNQREPWAPPGEIYLYQTNGSDLEGEQIAGWAIWLMVTGGGLSFQVDKGENADRFSEPILAN